MIEYLVLTRGVAFVICRRMGNKYWFFEREQPITEEQFEKHGWTIAVRFRLDEATGLPVLM